ncbi:hypothetical protein [Psychrobacillus sp. L4]|uniref:hypothetical protein n=1 Tax=Psychrobacillus sp. L4 TaxID=3236892 RepID=UPI0036F41A59
MGNEKIYPIDWMGYVNHRSIVEVFEWAETNQPEYVIIYKRSDNRGRSSIKNIS